MIVPHFAESVLRKWLKATDPLEVMEDLQESDIFTDTPFFQRVTDPEEEICWTIRMTVKDRYLTNIALALDEHREYFRIKMVKKDRSRLTVRDNQSWYLTSPVPETADPSGELLAMIDSDEEEGLGRASSVIELKVTFTPGANGTYGTFRQDVLFGFTYPPMKRVRLCVDVVPPSSMDRVQTAEKNMVRLLGVQVENEIFPEDTDPTKILLTKMYPRPDATNFFLCYDTLSEDTLTPFNYRSRLRQLARLEEIARTEQISRYDRKTFMKCATQYESCNDGQGPTVRYALNGELFILTVPARDCTEDLRSGRLFLRSCDMAYLTFVGKAGADIAKPDCALKIEDKNNKRIVFRASQEVVRKMKLSKNISMNNMHFRYAINRSTFCEWQKAIDSLPDTRLVFPPSKWSRIAGSANVVYNEDFIDSRLNIEQEAAVKMMAEPRRMLLPPILILGAFGTGKTFTIAQGVKYILQTDPTAKILLCTHSNSAADLYVKDYFDPWYTETSDPRFKPMRVYYTDRDRSTVGNDIMKYCLVDKSGAFRYPTNADLDDNTSVIITTLATSSCLLRLSFEPTHIVIDEAAQALECEAITPLGLATFETRLILAGDEKQLAPEIYSPLARERGFATSLLERFHNTYSPNHPYRVHLWKNYRAHPDIVKIMSDMFYDSRMQPATKEVQAHPNAGALVFHAVQGTEKQFDYSSGYYNDEEVKELLERVKDLRRNWPEKIWGPYEDNSIGVLVYYKEQVHLLRKAFRRAQMPEVNVERVLNVQGKQFTAVFISTVRSRYSNRYAVNLDVHDYGFFTNPRLMSTAMTRARSLIAVVGDPLALLSIGKCSELWKQFVRRAAITNYDKFELESELESIVEYKSCRLNPLAEEFVPKKFKVNPESSSTAVETHHMLQNWWKVRNSSVLNS